MAVHDHAPLDGNALAGPLMFLATTDMTTVVMRCASCGRTDAMAGIRVYATGMGTVGRCAGCDAVLVVAVERPDRTLLAMPGAAWMSAVS